MKKTTLELTSNEALVLIDFLIRFRDDEELKIEDPAEEQLLWDLCAMLESKVPELLHKDYKHLLEKARLVVKSGNEIE
ncbi:hypothetical protein ACG2LH_08365 [Zhouia sp. PK063]|uniref:hypothetical protein n=1 Tax=Zhouia sp. PK063 TaxID=3373602 RepID=UPI0037A51511